MNVPNPCTATALQNKELYHPHPYDDTKFIRCDYQQKMYVIQCPDGQRYSKVCVDTFRLCKQNCCITIM